MLTGCCSVPSHYFRRLAAPLQQCKYGSTCHPRRAGIKEIRSQVLIFSKRNCWVQILQAAKLNLSPGRHGDASCLPTGSLSRCLPVWMTTQDNANDVFLARDEWKWSHFAIIPAHWWILDDYLIIAALTYTNWPSKCTGIKRLRKTEAEGAVSSNWRNATAPMITQDCIRWSDVFKKDVNSIGFL